MSTARPALREHGLLLLRGGDSVEGGRVIAETFELAEAMPDSLEYPPTLLAVAELRLPNDPTSTVQIAERALALGIPAERRVEGHGLAVRGALALDDQQSARYHVRQACNLARKLGTPRALGLAAIARGRLEAAPGRGAVPDSLRG